METITVNEIYQSSLLDELEKISRYSEDAKQFGRKKVTSPNMIKL